MSIQEKIRNLCKKKGISVTDLEKELGFGNGSLTKKGLTSIRSDRLYSIAKYFDVSMEYFLSDDARHPKDYYLNDETVAMAQELFDNPYLMGLMKAARKSKAEDVKMAEDMLNRFKDTNPDG